MSERGSYTGDMRRVEARDTANEVEEGVGLQLLLRVGGEAPGIDCRGEL